MLIFSGLKPAAKNEKNVFIGAVEIFFGQLTQPTLEKIGP